MNLAHAPVHAPGPATPPTDTAPALTVLRQGSSVSSHNRSEISRYERAWPMTALEGVEITGTLGDRYDEILTPEALGLLATLQRALGGRREELLRARAERQERLSAGGTLDFLPETASVRSDESWRVVPPAPGLEDRRVE